MRLDRIFVLIVVCVGLCKSLEAQSSQEYDQGAVFGRIGWANVFETATLGPTDVADTEVIGAVGFEIRPIRPVRQLGFESEVSYMSQHKTGFGVIPTSGSLLFLSENLVVHPFTGRVEPYALVGGGAVILKENLAPPTGTTHGRILNVGGGLDVQLTGHWFVRPDVRLYAPRIFDKVFAVSGGLTYRW